MFSKVMSLSICLSVLLACKNVSANNLKQHKNNYKVVATDLLKSIKSKEDIRIVKDKAMKTIELALPVLAAYGKKHPKCKVLTDFIIQNKESIISLTPSQLELNYHDGAALPKFDEECYDIKELVVHPATVVSLSREELNAEKWNQMFDEIEEVLGHFETL